jgi:hypothetical protein
MLSIETDGFAMDHYNEYFDGLLSGINEEVTINDRRNDESEGLVFQAADMTNDLVFHGI